MNHIVAHITPQCSYTKYRYNSSGINYTCGMPGALDEFTHTKLPVTIRGTWRQILGNIDLVSKKSGASHNE